MVREISLIRGLGAPAKEMSFRHHLALVKDLSCPLLPTIARHCPLLPAKKMSQALVASQYGRRSRGPGRVLRAAPGQPGCTAEQTNHEPRSFLPRGASRREFRGFHESRVTNHGFYAFHESRDTKRGLFCWKSRQCGQNPASHRKIREARRSPQLPSPSGLDPLRWTRMDTQLPPPRQNPPSFVLIRVHSW